MPVGMPPDISYGLQCSFEIFNITGDTMTYYYRFNEKPLAHLIDNAPSVPDIEESIRRYARIYLSLYNEWFWAEHGTPDERAWCIASAPERFGRSSAERIESWLTHYISDMLGSGADPESRDNQRRWLDNDRSVTHCEKIIGQLARKTSSLPIDHVLEALLEPAKFSLRLPDQEDLHTCFGNDPPTSPHVLRQRHRNRNRMLKKAVRFLSTVLSPNDVTLFVGGHEIRVEGQRYVFALRKGYLLSDSHGGVQVTVLDKKADRRLFDLCWYVESTPALDQLAALALAVKAGEEDEIVSVGNRFAVDYQAVNELRPDLGMEDLSVRAADGAVVERQVGNLGRRFQFPDEDTMLHLTRGTMEYHRSHPGLYYDFSDRCSKRLLRKRFSEPLIEYFTPHRPDQLRPIVNGRVERHLFRGDDIPLLAG